MIQMRLRASSQGPRMAAAILLLLLSASFRPALAGDALKQGRAALQRNDIAAALPLLERAVSEEPTNQDAHATLARVLIRAHKYEEARASIDASEKLSPGGNVVPYLQGQLAQAQEDWDGAIAKYREALSRKPKYTEASFALGMALRHQGQAQAAFNELNRGLDFAGESEVPKFMAGTGLALMDLDSLKAAADSTERAAALDPDDSFTQMSCGEVYLKRQVWARAKDFFRRATQIDSLNAEAFYKLGLSHYRSQEFTDALQSFKTAAVLDSLYPEPQYWIGHLYVLAGRSDAAHYATAVPYLRNFTRWRPKNGLGWRYLGEALYHQTTRDPELFKEAATALDTAATLLDPSSQVRTDVLLLSVRNYAYNLNDLEGAFGSFQKLQQAGGKLDPKDILLVGSLYMSQKPPQFQIADSLFAEAAMADSTQPDPWYKLGESKFYQREYAAAIPYLRRRIEADSAGAIAKGGKPYLPFYRLGQCYNQVGSGLSMNSQALLQQADAYAKARKADTAQVYADSAKVLERQAGAMFDSASAPLKYVLTAIQPPLAGDEAAKVHLELGTAYAKGDSLNRALAPDEFRAAVLADSASPTAASALFNLAYLDYSEKRYVEAAATLEKASAINPNDLRVLVMLAGSYTLTNNMEKARAVAARGIAIDPNNAVLKRFLAPPPPPRKGGTAPPAGANGKAPAGTESASKGSTTTKTK
ncbi:MAG: tetratricopeptide repeat protein [Candidatus Eisenbacteria bacterium]|nr:tetratricopeptide repeat protein [Candidatus Eisenbacteria bacterium]